MMRKPRKVSGVQLARKLALFEYKEIRQKGSHLTLRTELRGRHTIQIPLHKTLRVGTLHVLLKDIATHLSMTIDELVVMLELS